MKRYLIIGVVMAALLAACGGDTDTTTTAGADQDWTNDAAIQRFDEIVDDVIDVHTVDESGRHVTLVKLLD